MAFVWGEPGTSPTQSLVLFSSTTGTVTSDGTTTILGQRSVKCDSGASDTAAYIQQNAIVPQSGRLSFRIKIGAYPSSDKPIVSIMDASNGGMFRIYLRTTGALQLRNDTTNIQSGSTVLSLNTEYRITLAWSITSTVVNSAKVFINNSATAEVSGTNVTLGTATTSRLRIGWLTATNGASKVLNIGQIYLDNDSSVTNPGDVRVTSKRPSVDYFRDANWTNLGNGSVSEKPPNTTNGVTLTGTGTGEMTFECESYSAGDVDISGCTEIGYYGWIYAAKGAGAGSPVDKSKILDGVAGYTSATVALTTTATYYTTAVIQSGAYTAIGMERTTGAVPDAILYDCGIVLAYLPSTGHTLSVDSGGYTVTGTAAGLKSQRKVSASAGSYSLSGTAAALRAGRKVSAASGAVSISGTAASFFNVRKISSVSGAYSVGGQSATLRGAHVATVLSGSYSIAGTIAALVSGRKVAAGSGSFAVSGQTATLKISHSLSAESGSYSIAGVNIGLIGINDGLVAYYPLDEESVDDDAIDAKGSKNLTSSGGVGSATGKIVNARDFELDNVADLHRIDSDFSFAGDFTASAWVNLESFNPSSAYYGSGVVGYLEGDTAGDWWLGIATSGAIIFGYFTVDGDNSLGRVYTADGVVSLGEWAHLVIRRSSGVQTIWLNGEIVPTSATNTDTGWANIGFNLGRIYTTSEYNFDGLIDEVGVWNTAKSDEEIAWLYNEGDGRSYSEFVVGQDKELGVDSGSFAISGQDATLRVGSAISASSGAYAVTGIAASFATTKRVNATFGSFAIVGQDVAFKRALIFQAENGSFNVSGTSARLLTSKSMSALGGSYSIATQNASLQLMRRLSSNAGAYSIVGQSAAFRRDNRVFGTSGSFAIAGVDVSFKRSLLFPANSAVFSVSGVASNLLSQRKLFANSGVFEVEGQDVDIASGKHVVAVNGSFSITGQSVSFRRDLRFGVDTGAYALSGVDAGLVTSKSFLVSSGAYVLSGQAVTLRRNGRVESVTGAYSLQGQNASLRASRVITVESGTFNIAGQDTTLTYASYKHITANTGAYALSGTAVTLRATRQVSTFSGAYSISGTSASLRSERKIRVTSGSYNVLGGDVTFSGDKTLGALGGSYSLLMQPATLRATRRINSVSGAVSVVGQDASLDLSVGYVIHTVNGSYTIVGQDITVHRTYRLAAQSGAYLLVGGVMTWIAKPGGLGAINASLLQSAAANATLRHADVSNAGLRQSTLEGGTL